MTLAGKGQFLYAMVDMAGTISGFTVNTDGSLKALGDTLGVNPFAQGIAAQ
jgi:hypothetical protein